MTRSGNSRMPQRHPLTLAMLACALFVRLLVPAGWMPSSNGALLSIEPCPAAAPLFAAHAMHHDHAKAQHGSGHQGQHEGDCSFAPMQASFATFEQVLDLAVPGTRQLPPLTPALATIFARGPPAPPPPATGPPISA